MEYKLEVTTHESRIYKISYKYSVECYNEVEDGKEFHDFPEQYEINLKSLKEMNNNTLSGVEYLEYEYNKLQY